MATLRITSPFANVTAGKPINITWSGGDNVTPVTITLHHGNSSGGSGIMLDAAASGQYFTWTPDTALTPTGDYSVEIQQGQSNDSAGPFALDGEAADFAPPASAPTATDSPTPSPAETVAYSSNDTSSTVLSVGVEVGISLVAVAIVFLLATGSCLLLRRRRRRRRLLFPKALPPEPYPEPALPGQDAATATAAAAPAPCELADTQVRRSLVRVTELEAPLPPPPPSLHHMSSVKELAGLPVGPKAGALDVKDAEIC